MNNPNACGNANTVANPPAANHNAIANANNQHGFVDIIDLSDSVSANEVATGHANANVDSDANSNVADIHHPGRPRMVP